MTAAITAGALTRSEWNRKVTTGTVAGDLLGLVDQDVLRFGQRHHQIPERREASHQLLT